MRASTIVPVALLAVGAAAAAQNTPRPSRAETRVFTLSGRDATPRAVIGVSTAGGVSPRDTLGLLITSITPGSPAEKSGLQEGDRLQAVDGTSLRIARSDVDDPEMRGLMQRRLQRTLDKVKPGDEVELRVYAGGQTRSVRVRTVEADSLYRSERRSGRGDGFGFGFNMVDEDRPSLGIGIGATGSKRDTLGVFVWSVNDSGPAAKAGIEEGDRIASIDGVDVRVSAADAGDAMVGGMRARRLTRELAHVKPGDEVTLRVYHDGRFRDVKLKAVRASDLPRRNGGMTILGGDAGGVIPPIPPMPPMPVMPDLPRMQFRFDELQDRLQQTLDRAFEEVERARRTVRTSSHS